MSKNESDARVETVVEWVFAIIGIVLLARLAYLLFNVVFNFSETLIDQRLVKGTPVEFLLSLSPRAVLIQVVTFVVIATVLIISNRKKEA
ncbi:hypothetical protein [Haladaptatus sp. DYF46]|uniref:hypothetical protein n=1 Tax=Haladaptatus sp. DYF46 TaxID=2886041 RepID=UPI001E385A59|nr:hypothetical protein [Haladaptatus sp. DYF46]